VFGKRQSAGFTLIEIMVAVVILAMIVIMMSTIFHQSMLAWDSGMRKSEGNMTARAALALMTYELAYAMPDDLFNPDPQGDPMPENVISDSENGAEEIAFYTLIEDSDASTDQRMVKFVTYKKDNDQIKRTEQTVDYGYDKVFPRNVGADDWQYIITNVYRLRFYASQHQEHVEIPKWVRIEMSLTRLHDVSAVGARSSGPDDLMGTPDDIKSW